MESSLEPTASEPKRSVFGRSAAADATLMLSLLPGVGPRTLASLLEYFGTAQEVLKAQGPELAAVPGVGPKMIHTIRTAHHHVDIERIIEECSRQQINIVGQEDKSYPHRLDDLHDTPPVLFVQGEVTSQDELAIAIVGTRHATTYGLKQAERFGYALAKAGVTVVSGLARGVDAAAHSGTLDAGGRAIAVLGGGHGELYPSEHAGMAKAIAADGAVISEHAPSIKPHAGSFPQRNRLIAGLSLAVLVIEAPDRSGALITARLAAEQGREVLVLPGPVTSRASRGSNQLIREGARLVQTVDDCLEELGPVRQPIKMSETTEVRNGAELMLNEIERTVLDAIEPMSTPIDTVIEKSGLPAHSVMAVISVLEIRRLVRRLSGQYVSRI
jgi:DNA processing protein